MLYIFHFGFETYFLHLLQLIQEIYYSEIVEKNMEILFYLARDFKT